MKRILTFMIAGIMVLSLSACGNTAPAESASSTHICIVPSRYNLTYSSGSSIYH